MLLLPPSSSGPLFSPTFSKLEKEMPQLSCKQRVNSLCSYLIWSEDQLRIRFFGALCSFIFCFFYFSVRISLLISVTLLHFGFRAFSLLLPASYVLFLFLFGTIFSPTPGVIQGSGAGSKDPLKCWLLWEYFKRPFHHVHKAALETKLKYNLHETSINSLESFVAPFFTVMYHFSSLWTSPLLHVCSPAVAYRQIFKRHVSSPKKSWAELCEVAFDSDRKMNLQKLIYQSGNWERTGSLTALDLTYLPLTWALRQRQSCRSAGVKSLLMKEGKDF